MLLTNVQSPGKFNSIKFRLLLLILHNQIFVMQKQSPSKGGSFSQSFNCVLSTVAYEFPQVVSYFNQLAEPDFARTGGQATETVVLDKGPLPDFGHSMEPQLRQMGMPVSLVRGVVTLLEDFTVCTEGATLTSEQARILKLLGHQQADFKLNLVGGWDKAGGEFTLLGEPPRASSLGEEEEEGSDME